MERLSYMECMEQRLTRTEEEALGAVVAVAEAVGKLEYKTKMEDKARWRSYVREVERTLEHIKRNVANAMPKRENEDVDCDEVIMMDEDDDTEFEQDQEDEPVVDMDEIPDGPDDPEGMQFFECGHYSYSVTD
ncbi:hypothetical protein ACHAW6_006026 [Cyclotella cf. meneghiniana]